MGLSFKPQTDDLRESPALDIIDWLLGQKARVAVYDPKAMDNVRKIYKNKLIYSSSPYEAIKQASALIIVTEWQEFKKLNLSKIKQLMKKPLVFDGRNIFNPEKMKKSGLEYVAVGRGTSAS